MPEKSFKEAVFIAQQLMEKWRNTARSKSPASWLSWSWRIGYRTRSSGQPFDKGMSPNITTKDQVRVLESVNFRSAQDNEGGLDIRVGVH